MTERPTPEPLHSETLTDGERKALRTHIEEHGVTTTAAAMGVSRLTVTCAVAGLRVRRGSIELIRQALSL